MSLISSLVGESNEKTRLSLLKQVHPVYSQYVNQWHIGLDAYDSSGGFLTGAYLWQFPRETTGDYAKRKEQARYHNYVETLIDIYVRYLTTGVTRETADKTLEDWWVDVDGRGAQMTPYVQAALAQALAAGHAGALVDKSSVAPDGDARSDDPNKPFLMTFTSPAMLDWRQDFNGLAAIKLQEAAPVQDLATPVQLMDSGFLLWDREQWARFDHDGRRLAGAEHTLGRVPMEFLRPKPSRRHPFIGKALVTPSIVQAFYNRASEEDVVLRDQAFSLFVVDVPVDATDADIQEVRKTLGSGVGTTTALIVKGSSDFKTAAMEVPATIRETQKFLIAEIWRMAHLRFSRESLEAESAEAIRLQRQDLDQMLTSLAEELRDFELAIARLYFDWTTQNGAAAFERAKVQVTYPTDFALVSIEAELTGWAAAISMNLGPTATKALKKRTVTLVLPDLDQATLELVREEIEAAPSGPSSGAQALRDGAAERLRQAGIDVAA